MISLSVIVLRFFGLHMTYRLAAIREFSVAGFSPRSLASGPTSELIL